MEEKYRVVYPLGVQATSEKNVAASLPDLNGKTIAELWNYAFRGDETFPIIEKKIREKYPDVRFVSYEEFGNFHDPSQEGKIMGELPSRLKKFKCDAVIAGNGA
jgi:hypothetical protein